MDSCLYLYVNGAFAGFSQVSHSTSAFDVTDLLSDGENTVEARVLKWCFGSYLEDQDKFRMSGIFRDVYLLERPEARVEDFVVTTALTPGGAEIAVRLETTDARAGNPRLRSMRRTARCWGKRRHRKARCFPWKTQCSGRRKRPTCTRW